LAGVLHNFKIEVGNRPELLWRVEVKLQRSMVNNHGPMVSDRV
jgi:hypothetical protein